MAVTTWTHRQVVDLFPTYQSKRVAGHRPRAEAIAQQAGVAIAALTTLSNAPRLGVEMITIERYRWRTPYTRKDPWTPVWTELVAAGLAARADGGWRVTPRGGEVIERITRDLREHLTGLKLPPLELRRATKALLDLDAAIPLDSERAMAAKRGLVLPDELRSDAARLDLAVVDLSQRRDDCHVAAWRKAGYDGPDLDVLSQVWEGKTALDDVAKALEAKQERADIESALERLMTRRDLTRDGDALALTAQGKRHRDEIERETDRRYFAGWPQGDPLARLGDDLTAIIGALP